MVPITRRRFVRCAAAAAAAPRIHLLNAFAGMQRISKVVAANPVQFDAAAVQELASQTAGQVITRDSAEYEAARLIFNRAFDKRPALIVRCSNAADIARSLEFSQKHGLPVAVRGGGHNRAGLSVCDRGLVATAPDELNVVAQVLPSERGAQFRVLACHCGDPRRGRQCLQPLRALNPSQEDLRVAPYVRTNATINPAAPAAYFQTNLFLPDLGEAAIRTISAAVSDSPAGARIFIVPFYGAVTRVRPADTAFALRSPGYELDIMGRWDGPGAKQTAVRWVTALRDELRPFASGAYVNQLGETSEELVRLAYGANYARLRAVKRKYDPNNVLRSNQNVTPG